MWCHRNDWRLLIVIVSHISTNQISHLLARFCFAFKFHQQSTSPRPPSLLPPSPFTNLSPHNLPHHFRLPRHLHSSIRRSSSFAHQYLTHQHPHTPLSTVSYSSDCPLCRLSPSPPPLSPSLRLAVSFSVDFFSGFPVRPRFRFRP